MADEREDKPDPEAPARETAVGHEVVEGGDTTEVFFSRDEPAAAPAPESSGTSPAAADRHAAEDADPFTQKPELFVAGAFVGAYVFAKLLKKVTGGGD